MYHFDRNVRTCSNNSISAIERGKQYWCWHSIGFLEKSVFFDVIKLNLSVLLVTQYFSTGRMFIKHSNTIFNRPVFYQKLARANTKCPRYTESHVSPRGRFESDKPKTLACKFYI